MPTKVEKDIPADTPTPTIQSSATSFLQQTHQQAEAAEIDKMQQLSNDQRAVAANTSGTMVGLPNRGMARLADLIDHDYVAEDHRSIFADAHKYLKDPNPTSVYCWADIKGKSANNTFAMERSGDYRRVEASELRDDIDIPVYTHKAPTGEYVCCYDVALMEQPAASVKRRREFPKQGAIMRTAQGAAFQDFAGRTRDLTGGAARAQMVVSDDTGKETVFGE